ncbi:fas-binding factor 1 [Athene noctua]|uniref:fas-binding factor 1 n=1 Tax=Athene noctua TaxID=126797 RepID=UPI003EB9C963
MKPLSSFPESDDDLLDDLLGSEDDESSVSSTKSSRPARGSSGRAQGTNSVASQKSHIAKDFFNRFLAEDVEDAEGSSVSSGEPQGLLQSLKDLDDLEADVLGASRAGSEPGKTTVKEPPAAQTPLRTTAPVQKRKELTFEDDDDDLMDALGLSSPGRDIKQHKKAEEEKVRPARAKLDELLGRGSVDRMLEEPGLGERQEVKLAKEFQKQPEKEEGRDKEEFVFGAYQPSVASIAKGRPARRQPVRFSAEKNNEVKSEPLSKAPPTASQSRTQGCRNNADWLGLKDEEFLDLELSSPARASPAGSFPSPAAAGRPGPTRHLPAPEEAATKSNPVEEEDWLSAALSRKKAQVQAKAQERSAKPSEAPGEGLKPHSPVSRPAASPGARPQAATVQDEAASTDSSRPLPPWLRTMTQASAQPSEAAQGDPSRDASAPVPTALFPREQETQDAAPLAQAESPAQGSLHERRLGASAAQPHKDATDCQAALLRAQARVAELESQVQTLELARAQDKLLLEILRQRHQEDLNLLDSTHRNQVKVLEETCRQREQWLRQEKDQLAAQLLSQRQEAEQERAELEQLRELQRVSVQELRREHEQQLQRLKRLKDQEVEAVTSATLHTRTLNGAMDLMEKLSSSLRDIIQKVEATQQMAFQELAMRAQIQENQLKVLQDRLSQQQKEAEEDRRRLQEAVAKLETRLDEQTRLLEQERQRVFAERSRAESLEEERQVLNQQLSAEQAELERMKERAELQIQVRMLRAREEQLERNKELLDKTWQELKAERESVNGAALRVQQQEEEMRSMTELSSQKYKEGQRALQEAQRVESQQESRLQALQQHLDRVKQQEECLHQDRLSMAQQRSQLQQLRQEVSNSPMMVQTPGRDSSAPLTGSSSVPRFPPATRSPGGIQELLARASSAELSATVAMMRFRSLQDRYYLENKQFFLESLKKTPYKVVSLPS